MTTILSIKTGNKYLIGHSLHEVVQSLALPVTGDRVTEVIMSLASYFSTPYISTLRVRAVFACEKSVGLRVVAGSFYLFIDGPHLRRYSHCLALDGGHKAEWA